MIIAMTKTRPRELDDVMWLRRLYVDELLSANEIAKIVGCSSGAVWRALRDHRIKARSASEANIIRMLGDADTFRRLQNVNWLRLMYLDRGLSAPKIAEELGCSRKAVDTALNRAGIPTRSAAEAIRRSNGASESVGQRLGDAEWLREAYVHQARSTTDIASELGVHGRTVARALKKHGIPTRSVESAMKVYRHAATIGYDLQRQRRIKALAKDAGDVGRAYTQVIKILGQLDRVPHVSREASRLEREAMDGLYRAQDALAQRLLLGHDDAGL